MERNSGSGRERVFKGMNMNIIIISNLLVGSFTLVSALGGVWLKGYLGNKKRSISATRQKALEAYALSSRLTHSLAIKVIICKNILKDKNYSYGELEKNNPDLSLELLDTLGLLIIDEFVYLKPEYDKIQRLVVTHARYLIKIILNEHNPNIDDFNVIYDKFQNDIVIATVDFRTKLNLNYINRQPSKLNVSRFRKHHYK